VDRYKKIVLDWEAVDEFLLCVRLRQANQDTAAGSRAEVQRIVERLRVKWPDVEIAIRGDSGFCRDELMSWCEANQVHYIFGLAKNSRLLKRIEKATKKAGKRYAASGKACRVFSEFRYKTLASWSRKRRGIGVSRVLNVC